jgi:L-ascorbate metabolism protein UlaG (beta-lactamase superfamily)
MKLTYFVNAMMMVEGRHTKVLCDPWVTFDAESDSGLFNFPPTSLTRDQVAAMQPDFIYITHTHADHFDPVTLELFAKDTPIIVSYFENNFTERNARELGFSDVRVSDPVNGLALNGDDHCWIEPSAANPSVDSIAVFRIDGQTVVNANDNAFHEAQSISLRERYGPFDLACVPFSFQGPYPAFYENLEHDDRVAEASKKKGRNFNILAGFASAFDAKYLFPFAAGAIYGGPKALLYPFFGVGTVEEATEFLHEQGIENYVLVSESCSFDLSTGETDGDYRTRNYETERSYIDRIAAKPGPFVEGGLFYIKPSERIDLTKLLRKARLRQKEWQERAKTSSQAVYYLDVGERDLYRLCLADTSVTRIAESDINDEAYELFRLPYGLMIGLLTAHYNWSNVKTQHMSFYRQPNIFDPNLHLLMSYLQV